MIFPESTMKFLILNYFQGAVDLILRYSHLVDTVNREVLLT